ncbi:MAG: hypothetical protein JWP35_4789 [Caulobacter sp.]|nr:hypothetical protein [Caulobacter sp.]
MDSAAGLFGFILLLGCYLIPTIIAFMRKHKDAPAIAALNILLGWSVLGWVVSFIWSLSNPSGRGAQTVIVNTVQNNAPTTHAPVATPVAGMTMDDHDTAFWDKISDKNDLDHLEEYLLRFPDGRFSKLAASRMQRVQGAGTDAIVTNVGGAPDTPPEA